MMLTDTGKKTLESLQSRVAAAQPETCYSVLLRVAGLSQCSTWVSPSTGQIETLSTHPDILEAIGCRIDEVKSVNLHVTDIVNLLTMWPDIKTIEDVNADRLEMVGG